MEAGQIDVDGSVGIATGTTYTSPAPNEPNAAVERERERGMAEENKDTEATENVVAEAEALPKTIVRRVVKDKLSQLSTGSEITILRDSFLAFSESARIFIHYLSATANDICKESNRQIISAEDVFKALEEIEFPEFIGPLRDSLEEFRQRNAGKKQSKAKESNTKAKRKEPPPSEPSEGRNKR